MANHVVSSLRRNRVASAVSATMATANTVSKNGSLAWEMTPAERLEQMCMVGTLNSCFYAKDDEVVHQATELLETCDPSILADCIVKGRNFGFIRSFNILGLVYLSKRDTGKFKQVFNSVIKTGNDLEDFINMCRSVRGFGRAVTTAVRAWLDKNMSDYYTMKYKKALRDAIKLSHYVPFALLRKHVAAYILDKDTDNACVNSNETIRAYEFAKNALKNNDHATAISLINQYRLDIGSLTGAANTLTPQVWKAFINVMPVMNTLMSLNTFSRNGALDDETIGIIKNRITAENLKKARVHPFRLYTAYSNITNAVLKNHLSNVLDQITREYDWEIFNKFSWVIAPDTSGSMTTAVRDRNGRPGLVPAVVAGTLSGIMYPGLNKCILAPWDTSVKSHVRPRTDSVVTHIDSIVRATGGGTDMGCVLRDLDRTFRNHNSYPDVFVYITDSENYDNSSFLNSWLTYKSKNKNAIAFVVRVDMYGEKPVSEEFARNNGVYQIFGWNTSVLDYMRYVLMKHSGINTTGCEVEE